MVSIKGLHYQFWGGKSMMKVTEIAETVKIDDQWRVDAEPCMEAMIDFGNWMSEDSDKTHENIVRDRLLELKRCWVFYVPSQHDRTRA